MTEYNPELSSKVTGVSSQEMPDCHKAKEFLQQAMNEAFEGKPPRTLTHEHIDFLAFGKGSLKKRNQNAEFALWEMVDEDERLMLLATRACKGRGFIWAKFFAGLGSLLV